jgi:phage-related protein
MTELSDCLQTLTPIVINFPGEIDHPSEPVQWALDMFAANLSDADMQFRELTSGVDDATLSYFDQKDPSSFERFKLRIKSAQPVHGSLPLIDFCAGDGTVRDNAGWAWQIYNTHFGQGLTQRHPMGSYVRATMWMSCGEHRYDAHCDLFDGFLFHMSGYKRVRVWPVPKKYRQKVVFNHSDFEERMESEPIDFDLKPGEILFIPSGAMHEVIALGTEPAVSVSFHMGSPFPMPTLCLQLNKMLQGGNVSLPSYMTSINKFKMYFFEPTRFIKPAGGLDDPMPEELYKALTEVLQTNNVDSKTMHQLLTSWWQIAKTQPLYQGPYPERVPGYE